MDSGDAPGSPFWRSWRSWRIARNPPRIGPFQHLPNHIGEMADFGPILSHSGAVFGRMAQNGHIQDSARMVDLAILRIARSTILGHPGKPAKSTLGNQLSGLPSSYTSYERVLAVSEHCPSQDGSQDVQSGMSARIARIAILAILGSCI